MYNDALEVKMNAYDKDKANLGLKDLGKWFHGKELKTEVKEWLNKQNTKVLKQEVRHMLHAYQRFFKEKKGAVVI